MNTILLEQINERLDQIQKMIIGLKKEGQYLSDLKNDIIKKLSYLK